MSNNHLIYQELKDKIALLEAQLSVHLNKTPPPKNSNLIALYENAPLSYQSLSANGNIIDVNPQWLKTLGYSKEEVIGKSFEAFLHPEWIKLFQLRFPKFKKKGFVKDVDFKIRHKNGKYIDIDLGGSIAYNNDGSVQQTYCIFRDVTAQLQASEIQKRSEEKYRRLFEKSSDPMLLLVGDAFIECNDATLKLLKYKSRDEVLNKHPWELSPKFQSNGKTSKEYASELIAIAAKKGYHRFEWIHLNSKGENLWIDVALTIIEDKDGTQLFHTVWRDITKAHQTKRQLLESNDKYKELFEAESDAIFLIHNKTGNILEANNAASILYGYDQEQFKNLKNTDLSAEPDATQRVTEETPIIKDNIVYIPLRYHKKKDGTVLPVEITGRFFEQNGEAVHIAAIRDITKRLKYEADLMAERSRAENIIEGTEVGTWDWNIQTDQVVLNERWAQMIGYTLDELKPININTWTSIIHPNDFLKSKALLLQHLNGAIDYFDIEFRMKHKKNNWIWVHARGKIVELSDKNKPLRMSGTLLDISLRKKAELERIKEMQRAEESEKKYKHIYNHTPVMLHSSSINGDIYSVNDYWLQKLGYNENEAIGANTKQFLTPESIVTYNNNFDLIIKEGEINNIEIQAYKKNRERIDLLVSSKILYNEKGEPVMNMTNMVDITEKKTSEREQQKLNKELLIAKERAEESDRLKTAFLANMSHEIRTPMNGILGFTELLKEDDLAPDVKTEYLNLVERSGMRLLNIINDLIDISKVEAGQMKINVVKTNLNDQLKYLTKFFNPEAERKGISIRYHSTLEDDEAIIKTDKEKLYAILTNLIKNAIKYTREGRIILSCVMDNQMIEFCVEDTGIGIHANQQELIFERFVRADLTLTSAYEGAGLGLSITKAYIEMLGGKIWVESKEHTGSKFFFTLPAKA